MDKLYHLSGENVDKLKERIAYLEKANRWNYHAMELLASLGELHKNINLKGDPQNLLKTTRGYLKRLINFRTLAFFLVDGKGTSFNLADCEPAADKNLIEEEVDRQIESGTFAWALKQNRLLIAPEVTLEKPLVFHALATQTRVLGMFVGLLEGNPRQVPAEKLNLISIVLNNMVYAVENTLLYNGVDKQNRNLKKTIQDQDINLRNQNFELKQQIDERLRANKDLDLLCRQNELILNSTGEGIVGLDREGNISFINSMGAQMTGYTVEELVGRPFHDSLCHSLTDGSPRDPNECPIQKALEEARPVHVRRDIIWKKDRTHLPVEFTCNPLYEKGVIVAFRDISEQLRMEDKIAGMAYFDSLTGLPNRNLVIDRLNGALSHAGGFHEMVALLLLDMDNFKTINEALGHDSGDKLLKDVANRLSSHLRKEDTIARMGGDEFLVLLTGISQEGDVNPVVEKILDSLKPSFEIKGQEVFISFSIGISVYPKDAQDSQDLFMHADAAMYAAKEQGKNNCQWYNSSMVAHTTRHLVLENGLRKALERDEFILYYQPKVDLRTEKIVGMEALIRWIHPESGLVPPGDFIPVAEESRLIVPIGKKVLEMACVQIQEWKKMGLPSLNVAVNLSGYQFNQLDLLQVVSDILKETGVDPRLLELEITETVLMENSESAISRLHQLKEIGLQLSIDDFGTGYSSLTYLKQLPIDTLKIDQSFVADLGSPANKAITKAIVSLAWSLNLKTVAEGVETEEQKEFLKKVGCNQMQGFLFSKPLPLDEFTRLISGEGTGSSR